MHSRDEGIAGHFQDYFVKRRVRFSGVAMYPRYCLKRRGALGKRFQLIFRGMGHGQVNGADFQRVTKLGEGQEILQVRGGAVKGQPLPGNRHRVGTRQDQPFSLTAFENPECLNPAYGFACNASGDGVAFAHLITRQKEFPFMQAGGAQVRENLVRHGIGQGIGHSIFCVHARII